MPKSWKNWAPSFVLVLTKLPNWKLLNAHFVEKWWIAPNGLKWERARLCYNHQLKKFKHFYQILSINYQFLRIWQGKLQISCCLMPTLRQARVRLVTKKMKVRVFCNQMIRNKRLAIPLILMAGAWYDSSK